MSAPSTSGLSVGLLLRVIDVEYGCLLYFTYVRLALHKTRTARINGTKQVFASYFRRDLHKTRLILEQNFWLFLFCPRLK